MSEPELQAKTEAVEAQLEALTRAQLDELAERRGLNPGDYANKSEIIAALLPSMAEEDIVTETTEEPTTPSDTGGLDPMLVDPDTAQQERFDGTTSDASTHTEGNLARDVPPDPNDDPNKPSDAEDYNFPPGGDVDIATVDPGSGEGERLTKPTLEDWVVLDGSHEQVPDALDGRRAAIINVHPENAWDERDLLKEEYTEEDVSLTVRTRDDYGATLYIPLDAIKSIERRGISPVRT